MVEVMTFLDDGGAETATDGSPTGVPTAAPSPPPAPFLPTLPPVQLPAPAPRPVAPAAGPAVAEPGGALSMAEVMARLAASHPPTAGRQPSAGQRRGRRRERRRRRALVRIIVLGAVTAAGLLGYSPASSAIRQRLGIGTATSSTDPEDAQRPATVTSWDPRVAEIVAFVEAERGLRFDHPVPVDFLPEAAFVELVTGTADGPSTTDDPETAAAIAAMDRAITAWYDDVGLAVGYAPAQGEADLDAVATLGFYTPLEDRVYVRGDQLTPAVRVVLAHELTHALQAQHFSIELGGEDDLTVRSIIEADAMRVEDAYLATLPEADRAAAEEDNTFDAESEAQLDVVPWAVVESRYAPYAIGPTLVTDAYEAQGNAGVDALLTDPPSEEVLISPWLRNVPQTEVTPPVVVPAGASVVVPEQRLSMFDMIVMLDAWLSWTQARGALDGWAGGRMVMYQYGDSGPICEGATIAFDASPAPMAEALTAWAVAAGSTVVPSVVDRQVSFEACPRSAGAGAPAEPVVSPIEAIVIEHVILDGVDAAATPEAVTLMTCYARRLIDDPSAAPLMFDAELDADEQAILTWVTTAAASSCGAPPAFAGVQG